METLSTTDLEIRNCKLPVGTVENEFGDAPEAGTSYPTTKANNGARHILGSDLYLGAGVGFVHKTGAVETAIPDIVRDYSSTRDARFNVNTGLLCPLVGPIGAHLNYDSAFNVASFGILFTEVF